MCAANARTDQGSPSRPGSPARRETAPDGAGDPDPERHALAVARDRWPELLTLEHEVLPLPVSFGRDRDDFLVHRRAAPGRPLRERRVPPEFFGDLLLQAAAAQVFFGARGYGLDGEDLLAARWDRSEGGGARLWLVRSPSAVRKPEAPRASDALAALLDLLARRGGRISDPRARELAERLDDPETAHRRADHALVATLRSFPALASPEREEIRSRTLGYGGDLRRDLRARAATESARAILQNRAARVFLPAPPGLRGGGALGLDPPPAAAAEAARRLRELAAADAEAGRAVWIAAAIEEWDSLSRRAFETASRGLPAEIEVRPLAPAAPIPRLVDEWRREIFIPCGSLAASIRFYEWLAEAASADPSSGPRLARAFVESVEWCAFATDPTGSAPLPPVRASGDLPPPAGLAELDRKVLVALAAADGTLPRVEIPTLAAADSTRALERLARRGEAERTSSGWRATAAGRLRAGADPLFARVCRSRAAAETDPERRVHLLLRAADAAGALEEARRWLRDRPAASPERWFDLAARLAAACPLLPPWLEMLEGERALAGGDVREARRRFQSVARREDAEPAERRRASLRDAETSSARDGASEAGRLAASWRREFPGAPPLEGVRALRLEARGLARDGRRVEAHSLLDEADRAAEGLDDSERIENALARASVLSLEGQLDQEAGLYSRWRAAALAEGGALAARFVSQEALSLSDRREFPAAALRLEEALAAVRDDPAESARVRIDLAATLYHSGRTGRCAELLREASELAAAAGRRDLLRVARGNRIELAIFRCEWERASAEIEAVLADAERESDDLWRLVGLHQRSRVALRRGSLDSAGRDNAHARELAERLGDRLEIGELWLEEGDRCALLADAEGARRAWERAAADPPDRCDTERHAAGRLEELSWRDRGGPPADAVAALAERLERGDYEAAETAARWHCLFASPARTDAPGSLRASAARVLRERGGEALADRVFGDAPAASRRIADAGPAIRELREALARCLAGEDSSGTLRDAGIAGLSLTDGDGRELLRLGEPPEGPGARVLEAGSARYRLALPSGTSEELAAAAALVLETLLFRLPPSEIPEDFAEGWSRFGVVTADRSMEEPYRRLRRFGRQPVTVLVRGESGSGKEAVARAVHALSPRASGPFVPVNVPAIPAGLLESELFGHVRGAFTGAERDRVGLFEEAARGTIFFDEIGDLDPTLQAKLLRVLQDREIRRVGENRARRIDVRVVSATSRDLAREVDAGRFREDLYYRLHVAVIALPPLGERGRDILRLARHFLAQFGREYGRGGLRLAPEAAAALSAHGWPGNVRELQNAIAQAAALADRDGVVAVAHLPETIRRQRPRASESYRSRLDAHRRGMISDALERAGGNRSRAARELGLSRQALRYLIKELNIALPSRVETRPPANG